jgi:hypothetical protein
MRARTFEQKRWRARRTCQPVRDARPQNPDTDYYRKLQRTATRFRVKLREKKWCDYWHQHFDWYGFGDRGWLHRRRHLNCLLRALRNARDELSVEADKPYQLFATVYPNSSGEDAIYVYTANPNGTIFPADLGEGELIKWLPPLLEGRVDPHRYTVRRQHFEGRSYYLIEPHSTKPE